MTFLGLNPIEWALVILATALVVGVGALPEYRGRKAEGQGQQERPRASGEQEP